MRKVDLLEDPSSQVMEGDWVKVTLKDFDPTEFGDAGSTYRGLQVEGCASLVYAGQTLIGEIRWADGDEISLENIAVPDGMCSVHEDFDVMIHYEDMCSLEVQSDERDIFEDPGGNFVLIGISDAIILKDYEFRVTEATVSALSYLLDIEWEGDPTTKKQRLAAFQDFWSKVGKTVLDGDTVTIGCATIPVKDFVEALSFAASFYWGEDV